MKKLLLSSILILMGVGAFILNIVVDDARIGAPSPGRLLLNLSLISLSFFLISFGVINNLKLDQGLKYGLSVVSTVVLWGLFILSAFYFGA